LREDDDVPEADATRLAVLIDSDNTTASLTTELLEEIAKYGTPTIKRAYGDWTTPHLVGWKEELLRHAIQPVQQFAYTRGKNSTDSALIIDAMDLLYANNVEAFAIVSSDSDFTSLALRLRESGKKVYGLGRKTTPSSLQNACDRFIALEVLMTEAQDEEPEDKREDEKAAQDAPSLNLQSALTKAVNAMADEEGWVTVSQIGNHLTRTHASFDPRNFGHSKLTALVQAQPYLETRGDAKRLEARLKAPRKAAKSPTEKAPAEKAPAEKAPAEKAPPAKPVVKTTTRTRTAKKAAPEA
jgi:uncharacterized protein (TIGR00288 family)